VLVADRASGERRMLDVVAAFIFIGAMPHTAWVGDRVARDGRGFILSGPAVLRNGARPPGWTVARDPLWLETSVPGVFVAGDVRHRSIKRIASAVGEGAMAVQFVHQHLSGTLLAPAQASGPARGGAAMAGAAVAGAPMAKAGG
jgi:thioredoxin reductase (NADPH)